MDPRIPTDVASIHDPFGNAVHTAFSGDGASELVGSTVVVLGCGPIGLFAVGVVRASGARRVPGSPWKRTSPRMVAVVGRSPRIASDVTRADTLEALHAAVRRAFGQVDILVNAAGITTRMPTLEMDDARWSEILDTNFVGTLRACRLFGRDMVQRRYGRIINIGSLTSVVALYEVAAYAASKAAVASLTKSLAIEWARSGVSVNAILPGVFRTALNEGLLDGTARGRELLLRTPMGRYGQVEDIVGAAIFLASESARFVTGQLLAVDGGFLASGVNQ